MYISKYLRLRHKIIRIKYYAKIQIFSNSANNYLHLGVFYLFVFNVASLRDAST